MQAIVFCAASFLLFHGAARGQEGDPCRPLNAVPLRIEGVSERGELRLSDGRLARLPGLDPGADLLPVPAWARHQTALRAMLEGQALQADAGQGLEDRWGRIAIHGKLDGQGLSLHAQLVSAGLARVLPSDGNESCQRHLLGLEAVARRSRHYLWAEPAARVIPAREVEAIKAQHGRYALVEGKVVSVNGRAQRSYVNFGRVFTRDFSVTVGRRHRPVLEKAGISLSSLKDKTVRVRGIVSGRNAPQIDVISPAQIEVVE